MLNGGSPPLFAFTSEVINIKVTTPRVARETVFVIHMYNQFYGYDDLYDLPISYGNDYNRKLYSHIN